MRFCVSFTNRTKEKPTVDKQKIKRRKLKHTTTKHYKFTKKNSKRGKKGPESYNTPRKQ